MEMCKEIVAVSTFDNVLLMHEPGYKMTSKYLLISNRLMLFLWSKEHWTSYLRSSFCAAKLVLMVGRCSVAGMFITFEFLDGFSAKRRNKIVQVLEKSCPVLSTLTGTL